LFFPSLISATSRLSSKYLYIFGVGFLGASFWQLGKTINGTKGWFHVLGVGLQPVEFVKIIINYFA
jgi:cell division protein FtsW (lipid II flippase)